MDGSALEIRNNLRWFTISEYSIISTLSFSYRPSDNNTDDTSHGEMGQQRAQIAVTNWSTVSHSHLSSSSLFANNKCENDVVMIEWSIYAPHMMQ